MTYTTSTLEMTTPDTPDSDDLRWCAETETNPDTVVRRVHDWDCLEELSTTVALAVMEAASLDSASCPPLFDAIDPEGLDTLFTPQSDAASTVQFDAHGFAVTVRGDGEVLVSAPQSR